LISTAERSSEVGDLASNLETSGRPLRILFFSHYFPPEGNAPASRVSALGRRWAELGHTVTVITGVPNVPTGIPYEGYRNRLWQKEEFCGIKVIRVWTYLAPNKGVMRRTLNYLSFMLSGWVAGLLTTKADVVVATSPQFFCGWAGAVVARLRGVPFVLEIRDLWPESIQAVGAMSNRLALGVLAWLERKLYSIAQHVVTVGEGYRQKLIERTVADSKITVISNGVDREFFVPRKASEGSKERYGLKGCFVCSYVGTVGMAAGLEIVLRAAKRLREGAVTQVRFLIVGDGAAHDALKQEARQQSLTNVIFAGRQPKEQIPELLALSDVCLVHLKKQDLFETVMPSKIFEALAMERPIILGVKGRAADFLRTSGGGICIEPEDDQALLNALDTLRSDPVLARSMGQKGRAYVLERFDRNTLSRDYIKLLQRLVGALVIA